jgi:hypothetical protein
VGLLGVLLGCVVVVAVSARGPSSLSPPTHSHYFPAWLAGPFDGVWPFHSSGGALLRIFDYTVAAMYPLYVLAVVYAPRLRVRWTVAVIFAVHVVFLLSPPLGLTDVFNYLNYGRMEIVHGLNPYATIPALEPHGDPAYALSNWHHLLSPYGPLFTIYTFALVPLGVATSFWIFKATLMLASLGTLWLVWRCAELLGRDARRAVLLVGLNPPVLVWGLGADHNDFLMVLLMMVAVHLFLSSRRPPFTRALSIDRDWVGRGRRRRALSDAFGARRTALAGGMVELARRAWGAAERLAARGALAGTPGPQAPGRRVVAASARSSPGLPVLGAGRPGRAGGVGAVGRPRTRRVAAAVTRERVLQFGAGAAIVAACAIKLPAAILAPILFAVASRRVSLLAGMAVSLAAVGLASYAAFGAHLPDLGVQSKLVTAVGLPNLLGAAIGLPGETVGLRAVLTGTLVVAVLVCMVWGRRRHGDWLVPAGVAVFVLVLTLSWQAPWYALWLLPLAALARRPHLRVAAVLLGVYLIVAFTSLVNIRPPRTLLQEVHAGQTKYLVH